MPSIYDYGFDKFLNKPSATLYTPAVYDALGEMIDQNQVVGLKTTLDGISTTFDATVGVTGANYQTIGLALSAGKSRLLVVDNTTEVATLNPSGNLLIYIEAGKKVDMGNNLFRIPGAKYLDIRGDAGAEIEWALTSAQPVFTAVQTTSVLRLDGLILDNNSTVGSANVWKDGIGVITNCEVQLPNQADCGISINASKSVLRNIILTGGGTSCTLGLDMQAVTGAQASQIYVDGTWSAISTVAAIRVESAMISDITFNHTDVALNTPQLEVDSDAVVIDVRNIAPRILHLRVNGANAICKNVDLNGQGTVRLDAADFCQLTNIVTTGELDDVAANNNGRFTNCRFELASSIEGDRHKFVDCEFIAGATVLSGADNNGFINCQFGADAGGGAATITINATSNNTRVVSCMTDAAISDAGTGTVLSANVVY